MDAFLKSIVFPQLATPKIDFIRCTTYDHVGFDSWCMPLTRSGKGIPNHFIRGQLIENCPAFIDGELGAGTTFQDSGLIMRHYDKPDFTYYVFDCHINTDKIYAERVELLEALQLPTFCKKLLPVELYNLDELLEYEKQQLAIGMEGVMIRPPDSGYVTGYADNRATKTMPWLTAIKRFEEGEAIVIDFVEAEENQNEQTPDNVGRMKRAHKQEFMFPKNTLGALVVKDIETGVIFKIGSGFTQTLCQDIWTNRASWLNKIVKYKWQKCGTLNKPRIPIFLGERHPSDMS